MSALEQTRHLARVVVYGRQGCHLCDDVLDVVRRVCAETGDSWTEVDVDQDAELEDRFTEEVPVTFVDGRQHDYWRVDETRLRAALARERPAP
ncbi:glutaredoxin family protein [Nocardioides campestrisoli]|uniref:glutaredoxin family protein n=1 Tax=Nocardioides campestrisoli TaxID=2736757 RepID=UPI0015E7AF59|nr:glutaredoxin family protein [Nocardioides campestrisoli]